MSNWTAGPNLGQRGPVMPPLAIRRMPKRRAVTSQAVAPAILDRQPSAGAVSKGKGGPMTLPQIVKAYAAEHDRREGGPCPCLLCADLRWHIQQTKAGAK